MTKFSKYELVLLDERMICSFLLVSLVCAAYDVASCNVFETKCSDIELAFDLTGKILLKLSLTKISERNLFDSRVLFTESIVLSNWKLYTFKLQKRWQRRPQFHYRN